MEREHRPKRPDPEARTAFPGTRAFVVQFGRRTSVRAEGMAGRIEHVTSGRIWHFGSLTELAGWVADAKSP
jgi:hypothetical protein